VDQLACSEIMQLSKIFNDSISAVTAMVSNGYAMRSPPIVNRVWNFNDPSSFCFSTQTGFTYVMILSANVMEQDGFHCSRGEQPFDFLSISIGPAIRIRHSMGLPVVDLRAVIVEVKRAGWEDWGHPGLGHEPH
jgi:hypothetical protein